MLVNLEVISIVTAKPAQFRPEPHESLPVLGDGEDMRMGQRTAVGRMGESDDRVVVVGPTLTPSVSLNGMISARL